MNKIKIIGAVLIIITSWLAGIMLSKKLVERVELLRAFKQLLDEIKRRIAYEMPAMRELIYTCETEYLKPFTDNMYKSLSNGYTIKESVEFAVEHTPMTGILEGDEKNFIIGVMASLGTADCESVKEIADSASVQLDYYIGLAEEKRNKNSKVYFITSLYLGFAAVILMI